MTGGSGGYRAGKCAFVPECGDRRNPVSAGTFGGNIILTVRMPFKMKKWFI